MATLTGGTSASTVYTAPVTCTVCSLSLTTTALASATVGIPYSQTLITTGSTSPLTYLVSGGVLPNGLTMNTSSGVISGTPTSSAACSFTIKVSDTKSCSATVPLTINGLCPLLTVTVTSATICAGQTATLTAGDGTGLSATSYLWSNGGNTASIPVSATATATYSVTASTTAGCSATATGTLTVNGQPQINSITQSTACVGNIASLTVNATNMGVGTLEYSLNGGLFHQQ